MRMCYSIVVGLLSAAVSMVSIVQSQDSGQQGPTGLTTSKLQIRIPKTLSKPGDGYDHRDALFGIPPYGGTIQQQVYYADSTLCDSNVDTSKGYPSRPKSNGKMEPWPSPYILMVDRGDCTFVQKVRNAQRSGAAAVLIADNSCLCAFPDCKPDDPKEACEVQEPIMADDGSGSDISIPSFLLFKQDADPIKAVLKQNTQVRVEMSFAMPSADSRVRYDLWSIPTDEVSRPIEKNFKDAAVALGGKATFTPHFYIYDGMRAGCDQDGVNECYNLCTNNGRYCAIDPDDDLDKGISGADIVSESLRRICIWTVHGKDGIGKQYWDYLNEFIFRCGDLSKPDLFTDKTCIEDAMTHSQIDNDKVNACIKDSGGTEGDVANKLLDAELKAKDEAGIILIPTLLVNQAPVRGQLSFSTALKAVCAGYQTGSAPHVCSQCANCIDEVGCVKHGKCTTGYGPNLSGGVSIPLFAGTMAALVVVFFLIAFIQHKRQQRQMQEQVRGILAQYMPLDKNNTADTSVGIEDTDREFTIT